MDDFKKNRLTKLLKFAETLLTKEEFLKQFKILVEYVKKVEGSLGVKIDDKIKVAEEKLLELEQVYLQAVDKVNLEADKIEQDNKSTLSNIRKWAMERVSELFLRSDVNGKLTERLREIDSKLATIRDGAPGDRGEPGDKGDPGTPGKDGSPDTPLQVRDKLESLTEGNKLTIEAIEDLRKELDELKQVRGRSFGGGFSAIAMLQHFVHGEIPVDSGDHLNFTLNYTPSPAESLKVYRSRARQNLTEDYTLSGRTLTLTVAFDSANESLYCDYMI